MKKSKGEKKEIKLQSMHSSKLVSPWISYDKVFLWMVTRSGGGWDGIIWAEVVHPSHQTATGKHN